MARNSMQLLVMVVEEGSSGEMTMMCEIDVRVVGEALERTTAATVTMRVVKPRASRSGDV